MKVFLRINEGVLTRKIDIPDSCLHTEFKLPYFPKVKLHAVNVAQSILRDEKIMTFKWDFSTKLQGIPVLDLTDIS